MRVPMQIEVESLEERQLLSWSSVPPATASVYVIGLTESRVMLNSQADYSTNAAISYGEIDWYGFTATRTGSYRIDTTTPFSNLDTVLAIYDSNGNRGAYSDDIQSEVNTDSRITVNLTAGNTYHVGVTNYQGTGGGSYSLLVDGPNGVTPNPIPPGGGVRGDDIYEENDTMSQATDWGTFDHTSSNTTPRRGFARDDLILADSADWYRFTLMDGGRTGDSVWIQFQNARGDLDLELYNSGGQRIGSSDGTGNEERLSLAGLGAGTYFARVYGYRGVTNSDFYTFGVATRSVDSAPNSTKTLYIDFDGLSLSRNDLVRFANGQWDVNNVDQDGNGVQVGRFMANRADREQVINSVLTLVNMDLQPFGVRAVRSTSVVENVGASTILVGPTAESSLVGNYGLASDVDTGNDNRTDIAFVPGISSWNTLSSSSLAVNVADVVLHEAGHTWGLAHVLAGQVREAMSNDRGGDIGNNLSFVNQSFPLQHTSGTQNSYEYMYRTFVTGNGGVLGQSSNGSSGSQKAETTVAIVNQHSAASSVSANRGLSEVSDPGALGSHESTRNQLTSSSATRTAERASSPSGVANSVLHRSNSLATEIDQAFTSLASDSLANGNSLRSNLLFV